MSVICCKSMHSINFERVKGIWFKRVKRVLSLTFGSFFVLFWVSLLSNFKHYGNIEFLQLNTFNLNLLRTMKDDDIANDKSFFKVLVFSSYTLEKLTYLRFLFSYIYSKKFKVLKKIGSFFQFTSEKMFVFYFFNF